MLTVRYASHYGGCLCDDKFTGGNAIVGYCFVVNGVIALWGLS